MRSSRLKGAKTHFEPLLQSSNDAELLPVTRFRMLMDPASLLDGFKPTGRRYTLGARVNGIVPSAFPAGPPAGVTLPPGQLALKASAKPLNLIIFADTDMLSDFLWVRSQNFFGQRLTQAFASNGDLVQNALDNLSGSADLISVRGRASFTRPFERVETLRRRANERFHAKEQELEQQLQATEEKLTALQAKGGGDKSKGSAALILTPGRGAGDRALPAAEAAHPQGAAGGACRSRRGHQGSRHDAQDHQHHSGAGAVRRHRAAASPGGAAAAGRRRVRPRSAGHERRAASPGCSWRAWA